MNKRIVQLCIALLVGCYPFVSVVYAEENKMDNGLEKATFAGGCFWCMQPFLDKLKGIKKTTVGYTGGRTENPTYDEISMGNTGHAEAIEVIFDPKEISYERIINIFWRNIDPTTKNRQFYDEGTQYRSAIFYHSDEQKKLAEASKKELEASGKFEDPIVTEIVEANTFYPAEDYHQDYYKKNPGRYNAYHQASGRDEFIESVWGKEKK